MELQALDRRFHDTGRFTQGFDIMLTTSAAIIAATAIGLLWIGSAAAAQGTALLRPAAIRFVSDRKADGDPGSERYYRVNRYGYGNYVRGADGSYGGYPAGSAGARELEINQELKCRYTPESC